MSARLPDLRKLICLSILVQVLTSCSMAPSMPVINPPPGNQILLLFPDSNANVELKREGWDEYVPVGFGTVLHATDLIKSSGGGIVLCSDLTVQPLPENGRTPCPLDQGWLEYNEYEFRSQRGVIGQDIPYIIFPRSTVVLSDTPLLEWHDTGAKTYTVSIYSGGIVLWQDEIVSGNSIQYPSSASALLAGEDYLLVVTDNDTGRSSSEDPAKGLGFRILNEDDRKVLMQRTDEINAQTSLDESEKALVLSLYYMNLELPDGHRLWGEASRMLEGIKKTHPEAWVDYYLGITYNSTSLTEQATSSFTNSIVLAKNTGELEVQALANANLWRMSGDTRYFDAALQSYEQMGDQESALKLKDEQ